ncbi:hypothetical protein NUH30_12005 [Leptospira sp. 85282-16]|uniref:Uncharacterized protein n=1 Tax=Leptospira montravelensis TaxID=2484961 RepID=A0ABY2LRB9_9LEPT|nr:MULTISPECIES: hypothetical protein [Leptospira]MCT8334396.1 hypothetical protein [Leptospira sp. 85282-16]TGK80756.1 hypothetical protein EHQ19_14005 [Leptospira montravelensis]TGL01653.1 hypothetical protein EHQ31_12820 [Leptospira montravelensis]
MEDKKKFNPSPFVEVRDPQLNVSELMQDIESKIPLDPSQAANWLELTKLSYKPESPQGFRKFDPAGTAHLFEKGISSPKFSNPKFWFIKGPIKYLLGRLISVYGLIDKKLSENRIRAFFSVLHELVRLGKRIEQIENRFDGFYRDHLLQTNSNSLPNFGWAANSYFIDAGSNPAWKVALEDISQSKEITVLFPEWGDIIKQLSIQKIPFQSITSDENEFRFIQNKISATVRLEKQLFPLKNILNSTTNILIYLPLNRFPSFWIEKLFAEISNSLNTGKHLYFSVAIKPNHSNRPFSDLHVSEIDLDKLPIYLETLGFKEVRDLSTTDDTKVFRYTKFAT